MSAYVVTNEARGIPRFVGTSQAEAVAWAQAHANADLLGPHGNGATPHYVVTEWNGEAEGADVHIYAQRPTKAEPAQLLTFPLSATAMGVIDGSELSINAQTYDGGSQGAIDALAALKGAQRRRMGKGHSFLITATLEGAATIADYLTTMSQVYLSGGADAEAKVEGRACRTAAARIDEAIRTRSRALGIRAAR